MWILGLGELNIPWTSKSCEQKAKLSIILWVFVKSHHCKMDAVPFTLICGHQNIWLQSLYIYIPRGLLQILSDGNDRIGAKIKTQTNPLDLQQNPKKSHAELPSLKNFQKRLTLCSSLFGCTLFAELCSWDTWALPRIFGLFWIALKNPYLNQTTPKKYLQDFPTP